MTVATFAMVAAGGAIAAVLLFLLGYALGASSGVLIADCKDVKIMIESGGKPPDIHLSQADHDPEDDQDCLPGDEWKRK